jgi:hypothetical protein
MELPPDIIRYVIAPYLNIGEIYHEYVNSPELYLGALEDALAKASFGHLLRLWHISHDPIVEPYLVPAIERASYRQLLTSWTETREPILLPELEERMLDEPTALDDILRLDDPELLDFYPGAYSASEVLLRALETGKAAIASHIVEILGFDALFTVVHEAERYRNRLAIRPWQLILSSPSLLEKLRKEPYYLIPLIREIHSPRDVVRLVRAVGFVTRSLLDSIRDPELRNSLAEEFPIVSEYPW